MIIDGALDEVMDTWPPQFRVRVTDEYWHAVLAPQATITQAGNAVDVSSLQPGMRIRLRGERKAPRGLTATAVEVLTGPAQATQARDC